jgi:nitric oxide reductase
LDYMAELTDKRIKEPKDDIISKLVVEQVKPGHLEKEEATQMAFLLLVAGNATMVNMIALVSSTDILSLGATRRQTVQHRADLLTPTLENAGRRYTASTPRPVSRVQGRPEEVVRPVRRRTLSIPHGFRHGHPTCRKSRLGDRRTGRSALPDGVFAQRPANNLQQHIKAGEGIIASNMSANRDEEVFENPNEFDMHRKQHMEDALGFGYGEHRCIAEHLAKAEMRVAFGKLLQLVWKIRRNLTLRQEC